MTAGTETAGTVTAGSVVPPLRAALTKRLAAAHAALGRPAPETAGQMLQGLLAVARDPARDDVLWLTVACVLGRLPLVDEVLAARRRLDLDGVDAAMVATLSQALVAPGRAGLDRPVVITSGALTVSTSTADGGGREPELAHLEAQALPRWRARGRLVGWLDEDGAVWARSDQGNGPLLLPWRATVVVPAPAPISCPRLAAVARFSGSQVAVVAPDFLPLAQPDAAPGAAAEQLADVLVLVKHAHRVVCLSGTAAAGHRGYADALRAQGLPGPQVIALAADRPIERDEPLASPRPVSTRPRQAGTPVIISVADDDVSTATLRDAVGRLHGDGLALRLQSAGPHGTERPPVAGPRVVVALGVGGHGLRLREELATGVPAVLADRGVPAEVATAGARTVDPDDDDAVLAAVRAAVLEALAGQRVGTEPTGRARTTWDELSEDVWVALTAEAPATA